MAQLATRFRNFLRTVPGFVRIVRRIRYLANRLTPRERIFEQIHLSNAWGSLESVSGGGSTLTQTAVLRRELPSMCSRFAVTSVLDAPCGDYNWMRQIKLPVEYYIGVDIVRGIIENNQSRFGGDRVSFLQADIIRDPLPRATLIICRDCLVHLSFADIWRTLDNFRLSGATFLLTTSFNTRPENESILTGQWWPLNLQRSPFCFPEPIDCIDEECSEGEGGYTDKTLSLWRLADLPISARFGCDVSATSPRSVRH